LKELHRRSTRLVVSSELTHPVGPNATSQAAGRLHGQKILSILCDRNLQSYPYSQPRESCPRSPPSYFFSIHLNVILPFMLPPSYRILECISVNFDACYMPAHLMPFAVIIAMILWSFASRGRNIAVRRANRTGASPAGQSDL
jgi:hypothetical protein